MAMLIGDAQSDAPAASTSDAGNLNGRPFARGHPMNRRSCGMKRLLAVSLLLGVGACGGGDGMPSVPTERVARAGPPSCEADPVRLVSGLASGSGSTIGPGGDLYVTEAATGRILRVDPESGEVTTYASGLPQLIAGVGTGGAMDIAFIGKTAYVLVTLVGPDVGGNSVVGIYRVDPPDSVTVVADIGAFSVANPPMTSFFVPTGVQYALEAYRGGFLVTDGHHNRVLRVKLDGEITEMMTFGNTVPTGLAVAGNTVYMAEAGPVPHLPQSGRVLAFGSMSSTATVIAVGAPLLVDVEFGRGQRLYALSQGIWISGPEGSPASPNTGALVEVNGDGSLTTVTNGLDRPTSLEFIGNTAYVVTLTGDIWRVENVSCPAFGEPSSRSS